MQHKTGNSEWTRYLLRIVIRIPRLIKYTYVTSISSSSSSSTISTSVSSSTFSQGQVFPCFPGVCFPSLENMENYSSRHISQYIIILQDFNKYAQIIRNVT